MKDHAIIEVPENAEFYKYWVVKEVNEKTFVYKTGFFTKEETLAYINSTSDNNFKLIKNEGWTRSHEIIDYGI